MEIQSSFDYQSILDCIHVRISISSGLSLFIKAAVLQGEAGHQVATVGSNSSRRLCMV